MKRLDRRTTLGRLGSLGLVSSLRFVAPQSLASSPALFIRSLFGATVLTPRRAEAFSDEGAFHPRLLQIGNQKDGVDEARRAASRWSFEVMRRTSAPGRLAVELVEPSSPKLLAEPLLIWQGTKAVPELSSASVRHLRKYLRMGGMLIIDDRSPAAGDFTQSVKAQLARILPESAPVKLPSRHVLYKTFYLLDGPVGRTEGPSSLEGIIVGKTVLVLFLRSDLLGALARTEDGRGWALPVRPGGALQREQAIRMAVNIAMYVLCSDYKDDQVHAPFLMRRRQREP